MTRDISMGIQAKASQYLIFYFENCYTENQTDLYLTKKVSSMDLDVAQS